ncbi:hypothetical protein D3C76_1334790 [compost metagenome]
MAENIASFGFRNLASVQMQVGAADGGSGDPEDDVVCLLDDGIRDVIDPDVVCSVVGQCSHRAFSCIEFRGYAGEALGIKKVQPN